MLDLQKRAQTLITHAAKGDSPRKRFLGEIEGGAVVQLPMGEESVKAVVMGHDFPGRTVVLQDQRGEVRVLDQSTPVWLELTAAEAGIVALAGVVAHKQPHDEQRN